MATCASTCRGLRLRLGDLALGLTHLVADRVAAEDHLLLRPGCLGLLRGEIGLGFANGGIGGLLLVDEILLGLRQLAEGGLIGGLRLLHGGARAAVFQTPDELTLFDGIAFVHR